MKKEHLILLTAGIILALIIFTVRKKLSEPAGIIKPGDKGIEIAGLQNALMNITGVQLDNVGVYDNETLSAVRFYMKDCSALYDYEKGYVDKKFASDLFLIADRTKGV